MNIKLIRLPSSVRGIYEAKDGRKNLMPKRALLIHPDAHASFMAMEADGGLVHSRLFSSAEASLDAAETKKGVQPPAYSGHNVGLADDVAIEATCKLRGFVYEQLWDYMATHGWYGYRRDKSRGFEEWHFNFLGTGADAVQVLNACTPRDRWQDVAEHAIMARYAADFVLTPSAIQEALASLGFYSGEIDGDLGPLSRQAAAAFGRAWNVPNPDAFGIKFQRTLSYVAADWDIDEGDTAPAVA
jgi:hypothetical protein